MLLSNEAMIEKLKEAVILLLQIKDAANDYSTDGIDAPSRGWEDTIEAIETGSFDPIEAANSFLRYFKKDHDINKNVTSKGIDKPMLKNEIEAYEYLDSVFNELSTNYSLDEAVNINSEKDELVKVTKYQVVINDHGKRESVGAFTDKSEAQKVAAKTRHDTGYKVSVIPYETNMYKKDVAECISENEEFLELKEELNDVVDYMHKSVIDADGFMTDYTWYKTPEGENVFIFGDRELYNIDNSDPDFETDNEEEANDWFNSYVGLMDEDDEDSFYDALSELE